MRYFFLNIKTSFFRLFEWGQVVVRYYLREPSFILIDALLALQYLFKSPQRISKAFLLQRREQEVYTYGETPLTTLDRIAKKCKILSKDCVYELGCGTARTCFWLRTFIKCQVKGIDHLPTFIHKARRIKSLLLQQGIDFKCENMLQTDLSVPTVIYLYGTCLEEKVLQDLVTKLNHVQPKTKIITVSYPLSDYSDSFRLLTQFSARFPWGITDVFLTVKK